MELRLLSIVFIVKILASVSYQQPQLTIDTSRLCQEGYQFVISWATNSQTDKINAIAEANNQSLYSLYSFTVGTTTGSKPRYLVPQTGLVYNIRLTNQNNWILFFRTFAQDNCTGLRTSGIDHRQQAIVVLNYHRQVNGNLYPLFFNSRLQTAAQLMASNLETNLTRALENAGYSGAGRMFTLSSVRFDAGTAIQVFVDYNISELLTTFYREVGFGFDWSTQEWTFLVGLRVDGCPNKLKDPGEECDDGNSVSGDGCSPSCTIESGWSCYDDYLIEGSVCTRNPVPPPSVSTTSPSSTTSTSTSPSTSTSSTSSPSTSTSSTSSPLTSSPSTSSTSSTSSPSASPSSEPVPSSSTSTSSQTPGSRVSEASVRTFTMASLLLLLLLLIDLIILIF